MEHKILKFKISNLPELCGDNFFLQDDRRRARQGQGSPYVILLLIQKIVDNIRFLRFMGSFAIFPLLVFIPLISKLISTL